MLARFYAGESTDGEETALAEYFATHEADGELEADRILFGQLFGATAGNVPTGLEERLGTAIDRMAEAEAEDRKGLRLWLRRYVASAAAAVMLCAIAGVAAYRHGLPGGDQPVAEAAAPHDTYDNPAEAAATAEMALLKFSKTLNKGLDALQ